MSTDDLRFTLDPRKWYAMEFTFPSGRRHVSPIYIFEVRPLNTGRQQLQVRFWHAHYPEGVQEKEYTLTVLHRAKGFLASINVGSSKSDISRPLVLLLPITCDWLRLHFPDLVASLAEDEALQPALDRLLRGVGIE